MINALRIIRDASVAVFAIAAWAFIAWGLMAGEGAVRAVRDAVIGGLL